MKSISIMQDNLKEHVENQREDFELYDFDLDAGWSDISNRMEPEGKPNRWKVYWTSGVAASLLLITAWVAFEMGRQQNEPVLSELEEVQMYYQREIDTKMSLVRNRIDDPLILSDLEAMDEAVDDLKADLDDNIDNREVVEAMMENYRLKLRILEKIIQKIDENERGKQTDEVRL